MARTPKTLRRGSTAGMEMRIANHFGIDQIDQQILEDHQSLRFAKHTLAAFNQTEGTERMQINIFEKRVITLRDQTKVLVSSEKGRTCNDRPSKTAPANENRIQKLEDVKNEKILEEYVVGQQVA